jgi:hypothetical protein
VGQVTSMYDDDPTLPRYAEPDTRIDRRNSIGYARPTMNAMAALAMVFAFVFFPLGIVFGHVAKRQIVRTGETGSGLATAALVIAYLFLVSTVCLCCGGVYLFAPDQRTR